MLEINLVETFRETFQVVVNNLSWLDDGLIRISLLKTENNCLHLHFNLEGK